MRCIVLLSIDGKKVFLIAAIIFLLTSIFSGGYHHFDEHFQILEFAGLKLGWTEEVNLPWEYDAQIRPALQPFFVYLLYQSTSTIMEVTPFELAFFLRLLSALLSFYSIYLFYRVIKPQFLLEKHQLYFLLIAFFLWFGLYNHVRFSSENISGVLFLIGYSQYFLSEKTDVSKFIFIGLILGFATIIRFHVGFMVFGFALWMGLIKNEKLFRLLYVLTGLMFAFLCGSFIDYWFYGQWTFTAWNYFEQNLILGKAASFGVEPWYYYLREILFNALPPFSLAYLIAPILYFYFRPKDSVTWLLLPFILVHFIVGHKELRFMFVIISFLPVLMVTALEIIENRFKKNWQKKSVGLFIKGFWITNLILAAVVMIKPADSHIDLYRTIYKNYKNETQLYFIGKNPYKRVENIHFYKRQKLTITELDSINTLDFFTTDVPTLVATNQSDLVSSLDKRGKQIYSSFPEWIKHFNFNNWMERTNIWYVFEINQSE